MAGRKGLVWVTALTVASLLLGGGALNALAREQGGRERGGSNDRSGALFREPLKPIAVVRELSTNATTNTSSSTGATTASAPAAPGVQNVGRGNGNEDDLFTPPARVTDHVRLCFGDDRGGGDEEELRLCLERPGDHHGDDGGGDNNNNNQNDGNGNSSDNSGTDDTGAVTSQDAS